MNFERAWWVATLPSDVDRRELGIVLRLEDTGVLRMKFPADQAKRLRDELDRGLAGLLDERGGAYCAARPSDGGSGDGSSPPPRDYHRDDAFLVNHGIESARIRGGIDHGRGRGREACPYDDFLRSTWWLHGFDEAAAQGTPR